MFKFLKEFFHLSNTELKGANVLLFLIVLVFFVPRVYYYFQETELVSDPEFENWIAEMSFKEDSVMAFNKRQKESLKEKNNKIEEQKRFLFNPNTVTYSEMKKLGFDAKAANILLKYRKKGAKFSLKKDLKKIYGITDDFYQKIEQYIDLPDHFVKKEYDKTKNDSSNKELLYFQFDPNTVTYSEMKKLGIDGKTANILLKYRGNKIRFYSKEDVLKVYGFTEEKYQKLENYIVFPKKDSIIKKEKIKHENPYKNIQIDINKANALEFEKLKGVGAYISKEIVKYRIKLGGFYSKNQLKEVYGITEEVFENFKNNLVIDKPRIKKININTTNFKELIRHSYISKEQTIEILKLKKDISGFNKIDDLIYYDVFSKKEFENLKHYLKVK